MSANKKANDNAFAAAEENFYKDQDAALSAVVSIMKASMGDKYFNKIYNDMIGAILTNSIVQLVTGDKADLKISVHVEHGSFQGLEIDAGFSEGIASSIDPRDAWQAIMKTCVMSRQVQDGPSGLLEAVL